MSKFFSKKAVSLTGKILTLMGVSLVFAACYAPAPMESNQPVLDDDVYYSAPSEGTSSTEEIPAAPSDSIH